MLLFFLVMLMTLLGSMGAFWFKKTTAQSVSLKELWKIPSFYLGCIFYGTSALMNIVLLRYMDYSVLYPMTAITYIWTLFVSYRFLGETITKKKIVGVALIFLGVILMVQ